MWNKVEGFSVLIAYIFFAPIEAIFIRETE